MSASARKDIGSARHPLVSVIIPAWNAQATLEATLSSVARQTYDNLEIIIVDDGSTDRTADIANGFCRSEPRARLVRQANAGVAAARNHGIAVSRGEWIAPIDADDLWHVTRIEKMVAAAMAAPAQPGFVYCWCRHIDEHGQVRGSGPRWPVDGHAFKRAAYLNIVGNGSGLLASREALLEIGGYDSSLRSRNAQGAEDLLVQIRIARRRPVALVREHLVGWRQTGGSMSSDFEQMDRSCRLVYRCLDADGTPVPRRIERRMLASSAMDVAEHYALVGDFPRAFRWLGRSLRLDPLRCGGYLSYRVARSVRRRVGPRAPAAEAPNFHDADPAIRIHGDPYRMNAFADLLEKIDLRRLQRLAEIET